MKTKLLFLAFGLFTVASNAQQQIVSFYGTHNAHFAVMEPDTPIDQSTSGANLIWNFNNMQLLGESYDTESVPTATELADFPGTTNVTTTTVVGNDASTKIYSKFPSNTLSLTGAANSGILLNYNTNNATLGTFPLSYGYNNSDNIAGSYDSGEYAGTFTGTIVTSVDAYGTLNLGSSGSTTIATAATRLKTVQTISLNYGFFTNIGTVIVTTYSYYGNNTPVGVPRFRSTETSVNVPLLSLNETFTTMEAYTSTLEITTNLAENEISIAPNPVENLLRIHTGNQKINGVTIIDAAGKAVLTEKSQIQNINVSLLKTGIYFIKIETDLGTFTKKIVKK